MSHGRVYTFAASNDWNTTKNSRSSKLCTPKISPLPHCRLAVLTGAILSSVCQGPIVWGIVDPDGIGEDAREDELFAFACTLQSALFPKANILAIWGSIKLHTGLKASAPLGAVNDVEYGGLKTTRSTLLGSKLRANPIRLIIPGKSISVLT